MKTTITIQDSNVENDTFIEKIILGFVDFKTGTFEFEFPHGTSERTISRFNSVMGKLQFNYNSQGQDVTLICSVAQPYTPPAPEPVVAEDPAEVLSELAPVVEESVEMPATSKKKKNG